MDAQPGWARSGIDPGDFPREMKGHIEEIYNNEYVGYTGQKCEKESEVRTLYDILKEAWKRTKSSGGTRCTMLELHPHKNDTEAILKSFKLRNSDYVVLRPQRNSISSTDIRVMGPGDLPFLKPISKEKSKDFTITKPKDFNKERTFKVMMAEHEI